MDRKELEAALEATEKAIDDFMFTKQMMDEQWKLGYESLLHRQMKLRRQLEEEILQEDKYVEREVAKAHAKGIISAIEDN